jgi:hypothetical protein
MRRTKIVAAAFLALGFCAGLASVGCDSTDSCTQYCDKNLLCLPPNPPDTNAIPQCIKTCQDLSAKDASYKKAIDTTADCYSDNTCMDIRAGTCNGAM